MRDAYAELGKIEEFQMDAFEEVFDRLDKDNSGTIDRDEMIPFIKETQELKDLKVRGPDGAARQFGCVLCQLVVSVVGGPGERAGLLRTAARHLAPGGVLLLSASADSADVNPKYAGLYADDRGATGEDRTYLSRDAGGARLYQTHHFTEAELCALISAGVTCAVPVAVAAEAGRAVVRKQQTSSTGSASLSRAGCLEIASPLKAAEGGCGRIVVAPWRGRLASLSPRERR